MVLLLRRSVIMAATLLATAASVLVAPAAQADTPNTISAFVQPMAACQAGRMNIQWCEGLLGAPSPIASDPAVNAPLWANTGYAICIFGGEFNFVYGFLNDIGHRAHLFRHIVFSNTE